MPTPALILDRVEKRFGKTRALDGLDLQVPAGAAFGLVGSNGAGKTTSFAVTVGLERPHAGRIDILGQGPFSSTVHAGRVAVMPQDTQFQPYAKLDDLLSLYARLQGVPRQQIKPAVAEVLEWVHLSDRARSPIRTLSHGMRRRVVIAQAFLGRPELVLLDEPMSGLDPREVVNIRKLLRNRPGHQTVVISSHNLHELERICDHVAFIEKGKLVRQARMDDVTERGHSITVTLGADAAIDLNTCRSALPELALEILDNTRLVCRSTDRQTTVHEINQRVLSYLLSEGIPMREVREGSDLESIYIEGATCGTSTQFRNLEAS